MGRSVDRLSNAQEVTYFSLDSNGYEIRCDCDEYWDSDFTQEQVGDECTKCESTIREEFDEMRAQDEWDDFKSNLIETIKDRYPSLSELSGRGRWDDETQIILENSFAEIGLAEYCGCVSLSIRPIEDDYDGGVAARGAHWIDQVWNNLCKALDKNPCGATRLYRQGTFSNGESVYRAVS